MHRILLAILLCLATAAVVAHGLLVYQCSAQEYMLAGEESSDEKPLFKETKDISKEAIAYSFFYYQQSASASFLKSIFAKAFTSLKGFYDTPFNPPDHL